MIAFSPNGDHLVVYRRKIYKLDIYLVDDTDSLFDVLDKIDNEETPLVSFSQKKLLSNLKNIKFDPESRFLALYGLDNVRIINLMM